jgi:hypothetical protein
MAKRRFVEVDPVTFSRRNLIKHPGLRIRGLGSASAMVADSPKAAIGHQISIFIK